MQKLPDRTIGLVFGFALFGMAVTAILLLAVAGFLGWHMFWALYFYLGGTP